MTCRLVDKEAACIVKTDGSMVSGFVHTSYGEDEAGVLIIESTLNTDAQDAPIAAADIASVSSGACAVPDPEWIKMCDVQADGSVVEFYQLVNTTYDATGAPVVTTVDKAIDKVTDYTPTGTVGACAACKPVAPLGVVDGWGK